MLLVPGVGSAPLFALITLQFPGQGCAGRHGGSTAQSMRHIKLQETRGNGKRIMNANVNT
jgi:hypothetical protein